MRPWPSLRPWLLPATTLLWLWAGSVFAPWAQDRAPRPWLHDLLFYLRFVLLAWAAAEILSLAWRRKGASLQRALPLAAIAVVACTAWAYGHTAAGLRWKVTTSRNALAMAARAGYNDQRRRAGHFLVDTSRVPCGAAQPWLWLGRPHGGGTGTNLALVRSGSRVPDAPPGDAFVFASLTDGWWMAYQHGARYRRAMPPRSASAAMDCMPGTVVTHRQGMAFVDAGR